MAAVNTFVRTPGKVAGFVGDGLEEVGRQLSFYGEVMGQLLFNWRIKVDWSHWSTCCRSASRKRPAAMLTASPWPATSASTTRATTP